MKIGDIIKSPAKYPYYLAKLGATVKGKALHNGVRAYWWDFLPNAGDLITPYLLRHYGLTPIHTWKDYAGVLSCGSILQNLPEDFSGYIIGSGLLNPESAVHFKKAKILAVRGALTRDRIGAPKDLPLGDPGLLANQLCAERQNKEYAAGFVPHYSDKTNPIILALLKKYPKDLHFIDIQHNPKRVLKEIDKCECIFSTSLHGLVFADALQIPSAWVVLGDPPSASKRFKYLDYNSALKREQQPIVLKGDEPLSSLVGKAERPAKVILEEVQQRLDSVFLKFRDEILAG